MTKPRGYSIKLLSLLSSASVAIAPAAVIGATSVLLAPSTALAANECAPVAPTGTSPSDNGSTADTYICNGTFTASGINYSTDGNLTITGTSALNTGAFGVNLIGNGANTINWSQTTGTISSTVSGDYAFDVDTGSGTATIGLQGVTGSSAGMLGAVHIRSTTGTVSLTTDGSVSGRVYGIFVQHTGGSGTTTINANNAVSINATDGFAAIYVDNSSSTSATTVNVGTGSGTVNGSNYSAIRLISNGSQTVSISSGRTVSAGSSTVAGAIRFEGTGTRTINNSGTLSAGNNGIAVRATGGTNLTLNNNSGASLSGTLDLSGLTGSATINNNATWSSSGVTQFNSGTSTVNNNASGAWNINSSTVNDLDTLANAGTLSVGNNNSASFVNLGAFNNSGTIALGRGTLTANGTTFTASGNSLLTLTIDSNGSGLLDLSGSTVSGTTAVQINAADTTAFADPIVVIDVTGGTVDESNFALDSDLVVSDPGSFFGRTLVYNGAQQFVVMSAPTNLALEYVPALQESLSAWHTTADIVNDRNATNRTRDRGMWIRVAGDRSERDFMPTVSGVDYNASYSTYTGAAVVGFDVLAGSSDSGDYYLGIDGGLVRTRMEFDNSDTTDDMDGVTLGAYGGISKGGLVFDGLFNVNLLNLDHNEPINGDTSTNVISIGGRGEVGYVWNLSESFYVEPIATGAYVKTTIDDVFPTTNEVNYDEIESARLAAGLRIGANAGTVMGPVGFWLTGRLWKEFKDESNVTFKSSGAPDYVFVDDMSGEFQELSGGLTLDAGAVDFFIQGGAKFYEHDEYDNYNGSIGVRWSW